jgi:hypothetical protein
MYENIRKNLHHDEQAAYITEKESEPLRSHEPLRKKNLIKFNLPNEPDCKGGMCFPGEKHISILPNMTHVLPSHTGIDPLKFMDARLNAQNRKLDIFRGLLQKKTNYKRKRY